MLVLFLNLLGFTTTNGQCYMGNGQVRPSYCNLVVLMDPTFVAQFGNGNAQVAKAKALPDIEGAVNGLNTIFSYYGLSFKVVFFPTSYLIPSYFNYNAIAPWSAAIRANFKNNYPCIQSDVIIALTSSFSTGGGHGNSGVAAVSGNLSPWLVAHEIGHNIGLTHEGGGCEANCSPLKFMCELNGNIISFNECDYENIADEYGGVFSYEDDNNACFPCRCNIWADFVDVFPDNYICPVTPKVSITSDQPYLTLPSEGCVPDRSNSMIAVTVNGGENGVVNGRLRIRYQPTIYKWEELEGVDFDVSEDLPTNDPDYPNFKQLKNFISGSADEYIFQLAPYEDITFYTKIKYMPAGGINPSSELPLRIKARLISSNSNQPITSILGPKYLQTASGSISFFNANQPYLVTGDLTLDLTQGVSMFTMPPLLLVKNGAKIKLPSANINGVYRSVNLVNNGKPGTIAGCNTMWQGFEVDELSKLEISNATVKDAQFAVNLKRGAILVANSTKFINNNFGVYTNPAGKGSHAISILGASFETAGNLLPSYSGQTPALLENDKGFVGIYLSNVYNPVTISIDPNTGQPASFKNLKYGIISKNAQLVVNSAMFDDITSVEKGTGYNGFVSGGTGRAIYAERGLAIVTKKVSGAVLEFDNCKTAVEVYKATNRVWNANMNNVTNGIVSTGCDYATYLGNTINASDHGIALYHAGPFGMPPSANTPTTLGGIYSNTITMDGNSKGIAISTYGTIVPGVTLTPEFIGGEIASNQITLKNGSKAIDINNANEIQVNRNQISLLNSSSNKFGIYLGVGENNLLSCNNISSTANADNAGIYAIHPSKAAIRCNQVSQAGKGIQVEGLMVGKSKADIAGNYMIDSPTGLYYGVDAITGNQLHRGNRWQGVNSFAFNEGGNFGAIQSKYTVDVSENPQFLPIIVQPQNWFEIEQTTGLSYQCPYLVGNCLIANNARESDANLDITIAKNLLTGTSYQAHNNWLAQRRLYERISNTGNPYVGNSDINNFLTVSQNNGIASFANVQTGIRNLNALDQNVRSAFHNYDRTITDNLNLLDSLEQLRYKIGITSLDSAVYQSRIGGLRQMIAQAAYNKDSLINITNTIRIITAQALLTQNNNLNATTVYAGYEKTVNDIFLRTLAQGIFVFTSQDSATLTNLAGHCPLSDGEAVLRARAMLASIQNSLVAYDDRAICNSPREQAPLVTISKNMLLVYPNPASDKISITYNLEGSNTKQFYLFNATGQLVKTMVLPSEGNGTLQIDASTFSNGVYFYQTSGMDTQSLAGKLLIQH